MKMYGRKIRLHLAVLLCCCSVVAAFLLDDNSDEGTFRATINANFHAIQQLNNKVTEVLAENERLRGMLEAANNTNAKTLSNIQMDVASLGSRVYEDFITFDNNWILAFRATAGIGQSVYDAWTRVGHHDDDPITRLTMPCGCTSINGSLPCDRHYRSRLLNSWPSNSIDQVRLVLYENGEEKVHVTFTGTGSDYMSWFSQSRVIESSWIDLKTATQPNFFSIDGDTEAIKIRRFFINNVYNNCPADVGWLLVKDNMADMCSWATMNQVPAFLYSPYNHDVAWNELGFRKADVMAVFVKFRPLSLLNKVCRK